MTLSEELTRLLLSHAEVLVEAGLDLEDLEALVERSELASPEAAGLLQPWLVEVEQSVTDLVNLRAAHNPETWKNMKVFRLNTRFDRKRDRLEEKLKRLLSGKEVPGLLKKAS